MSDQSIYDQCLRCLRQITPVEWSIISEIHNRPNNLMPQNICPKCLAVYGFDISAYQKSLKEIYSLENGSKICVDCSKFPCNCLSLETKFKILTEKYCALLQENESLKFKISSLTSKSQILWGD